MIAMYRYLGVLFLLVVFTSCNDGDIIVTSFDFENQELSVCGEGTSKVLYNINNENIFETISFTLSSSQLSNLDNVLATNADQPINLQLTGSNEIIYRNYDGTVPSNYFCGDIPPSSPKVIEEFKSVGGTVEITTIVRDETDHDKDGILSVDEGMNEANGGRDTDGDGIPDYLDIDDDGDNVKTSVEIANAGDDPTAGGYRDSDGDGTPNYLDSDDDEDGVPTKMEVTQANQDPASNFNEGGIPKYLDLFSTDSFNEVDYVIENKMLVRFRSSIDIQNLKLKNQGGDGEEISFTTYNLGFFNSASVEAILEPSNP
jgi:hypothetical protein